MASKKLTPEEIAQLPLSPADRMRLALHYGHSGAGLTSILAAPPSTPKEAVMVNGLGTADAVNQFAIASHPVPRAGSPTAVAYVPATYSAPTYGKPTYVAAPTYQPTAPAAHGKLTADELEGMKPEGDEWKPAPFTAKEIAYIKAPSAAEQAKITGGEPEPEYLGGDTVAPTAAAKAADAKKAKAMGYDSPYAPAATPGTAGAPGMEGLKWDAWQVIHNGGAPIKKK